MGPLNPDPRCHRGQKNRLTPRSPHRGPQASLCRVTLPLGSGTMRKPEAPGNEEERRTGPLRTAQRTSSRSPTSRPRALLPGPQGDRAQHGAPSGSLCTCPPLDPEGRRGRTRFPLPLSAVLPAPPRPAFTLIVLPALTLSPVLPLSLDDLTLVLGFSDYRLKTTAGQFLPCLFKQGYFDRVYSASSLSCPSNPPSLPPSGALPLSLLFFHLPALSPHFLVFRNDSFLSLFVFFTKLPKNLSWVP